MVPPAGRCVVALLGDGAGSIANLEQGTAAPRSVYGTWIGKGGTVTVTVGATGAADVVLSTAD
jgi:hypothetical protein